MKELPGNRHCEERSNPEKSTNTADALSVQNNLQLLSNWFEKGKPLKDAYFKDMGLDIENPEVEAEFQKHEAWKQKTQISATPTVLINGYKLPESYKIEDLRYFTDLTICLYDK